jgi:mRNA interferase RelE/StbE
MYEIRLFEEAKRNLARLDRTIARRILRKLNWLAKNAEMIAPRSLRKNLSDFAKLREGDYRIIYQVSHEEEIVFVRFIGHRREIYKNK